LASASSANSQSRAARQNLAARLHLTQPGRSPDDEETEWVDLAEVRVQALATAGGIIRKSSGSGVNRESALLPFLSELFLKATDPPGDLAHRYRNQVELLDGASRFEPGVACDLASMVLI
jgi:hypothetical protein